MGRKRIAILMHERDNASSLNEYLIRMLADLWLKDGHEVIVLFGARRSVPADLLVVHVDLSVVPDEYLEIASAYPVALNHRLRDIRKSTFSTAIVTPESGWSGPVIVKTNENHGGMPELRRRVVDATGSSAPNVCSMGANELSRYAVYPTIDEVPKGTFDDPRLIVERFHAEMEDGMYCVRLLSFLGDRLSCVKLKGPHPIVNGTNARRIEKVEPHAAILQAREQFHCDYGKLDYVVVDGRAILLDVNKTVGAGGSLLRVPRLDRVLRDFASGLYGYL